MNDDHRAWYERLADLVFPGRTHDRETHERQCRIERMKAQAEETRDSVEALRLLKREIAG